MLSFIKLAKSAKSYNANLCFVNSLKLKYSAKLIPSKNISIHTILTPKTKNKYSCSFIKNFATSSLTRRHSSLNFLKGGGPVNPKLKKNFGLISIGGVLVVLIGYDLYGMYNVKKEVVFVNESGNDNYILKSEEVPVSHPISRSVKNANDQSGLKITLYQFQTCPFCCKVRTFLDYYGFSYDVVEVNSLSRKETKWSKYRKVPFIVLEKNDSKYQLKDSSMIISALQSLLRDKNTDLESVLNGYPIYQHNDSGKLKSEIHNRYFVFYGKSDIDTITEERLMNEREWRKWTDDVYVHMLSPNVYRSLDESFQAFEWFSKAGNWEELFTSWERSLIKYVGATAMYVIGKRLKKRHHLKDNVRISLYDESRTFLKETKKNKFIGGDKPNLADLNIYGVLSAIEGCNAFQDLLQNVKMESWFYSVKSEVENHNGSKYLVERFSN